MMIPFFCEHSKDDFHGHPIMQQKPQFFNFKQGMKIS